ncbi:MAG: putative adhesin, partial [Pseudomonas caspiana]
VSRKVEAFAVLDTQNNSAVKPAPPGYTLTDKLMAGTSRQGMIKNYTLGKFQSPNYESYRDISHIVRNSNSSLFLSSLPPAPMDILTVRNRFGMPNPSLENLFEALADSGIHYDRIVLLHCRCSLLKALVGQAPVYRAP